MLALVVTVHIIIAILIVALVLLQQGKGATMGATFGSGASQTVFGSRGAAPFLFKLTCVLVGLFFITSVSLTYLNKHAQALAPSTEGLSQTDFQNQQAKHQALINQAKANSESKKVTTLGSGAIMNIIDQAKTKTKTKTKTSAASK